MGADMPTLNNETYDQIMERISAVFQTQYEPLEVDGKTLEVLGITNMREHIDGLLQNRQIRDPLLDLPLWAKIWPSSFILGRFLRKFDIAGKSLLEVGSGMGVCGMIGALLGFEKVTLTDSNAMALDFARANILHNHLEAKAVVRHLDLSGGINDDLLDGRYDFIAASEILYLDKLHRPLLKLADKFLAPCGKAFFCTDRARLQPHFKKMAQKEFSVQEGHIGVKTNDAEDGEQRKIYNILILEKK